MSEGTSVVLFGHSFPARLARYIRNQQKQVSDFLGLGPEYSVVIDGHPGLTYARAIGSFNHYTQRMKRVAVDILLIDLGTNDLCDMLTTPGEVVKRATRFLNLLTENGISPKHVVFLSVIQRSVITRRGQVAVSTFNHRVRRFNSILSHALSDYPNASMYAQRRINHPKFLVDGCHLTPEGMVNYGRNLKGAVRKIESQK